MSKPDILQMGPYPDWDQGPLDAAFHMHRYFQAADKAAVSVRALALEADVIRQ